MANASQYAALTCSIVIFLVLIPALLHGQSPTLHIINEGPDSSLPSHVVWDTMPSVWYELQKSLDLKDWLTVEGYPVEASGSNLVHQIIFHEPSVFYRLRLPVPPSTGTDLTIEVLGLELIAIPAGIFTMGSPNGEKDRGSDEGPLTEVTISRPFWLGKYEVTQGQWKAVMGNNPSRFSGDDRLPVDSVSWHDAVEFCEELNERFGDQLPAGYRFGLPTEAQWEYACRAGTTTRFSYGDDLNYTELSDHGWYRANSSSRTHPVGEKIANPWGLHDMHGNVREWCSDRYLSSYPGGSVTDPVGPNSGSTRVLRGGSWVNDPGNLRSAVCGRFYPSLGHSHYGFRVALQFTP